MRREGGRPKGRPLDLRRPDFSRRAEPSELAEWMDEPCSYKDFRDCLVDLRQVNRLTRGYRPTLAWLDAVVARGEVPGVLRVVDVGCGGGDMLREIARWARRRGVRVALTGVDLNPYAARAAREFASEGENIEFVTGDAFTFVPKGGIDVVVSSLFTHHLETPEVVRFVEWMEAQAQVGWFVNDLRRSADAAMGFKLLATVLRWHRFVRHDGPVSFERAFVERDWERIGVDARIPAGALEIRAWRPGRMGVGRVRSVNR